MVPISCPACQVRLQIKPEMMNMRIRCTRCSHVFQPSAVSNTPQQPAAPQQPHPQQQPNYPQQQPYPQQHQPHYPQQPQPGNPFDFDNASENPLDFTPPHGSVVQRNKGIDLSGTLFWMQVGNVFWGAYILGVITYAVIVCLNHLTRHTNPFVVVATLIGAVVVCVVPGVQIFIAQKGIASLRRMRGKGWVIAAIVLYFLNGTAWLLVFGIITISLLSASMRSGVSLNEGLGLVCFVYLLIAAVCFSFMMAGIRALISLNNSQVKEAFRANREREQSYYR